ncbi:MULTISPECIES: MerR family transcriptional regulator [Cyanophyceae]|uniref:MerR family transcriptional regulator n=1 Tax=Leptolyngbya subtilissima DQ-A4 TaxID=2933933 RepID=A0ABV0K012_9CYAN|nr:MerR family transcriptional regulator [Nodosilinea sp. FACHB-141]MBD2110365.1 MerR family transcriptional regulator [Nodosilinea sp. FACHB-141]
MSTLQQIAKQQPEMVLDRFVEVTNDLLPQFLPDQGFGNRGQEPVNPRLVRHYTTQGWLDKPLKQGREARYTYRHLLQLLVLRRLLAEGYSTSSIGSLLGGQSDSALENILQGGVQIKVEAANPALAFLSQIRDRPAPFSPNRSQARSAPPSFQALPAAPAPAPAAPLLPPAALPPQTWTRLDILDGLELHVRQDFVAPATAYERDSLLQLIADHLAKLQSLQRPPP